MAHLSVVIPVYKSENCLLELYRRLKFSLNRITRDHEIIFVEDCGGDNSWNIILKLAKNDKRVKGIQLSRNFGQHYAISAGLDYCDAQWVVVMDCDLQDRPEEIPKLYSKAQEGYDVVLALRMNRKDGIYKRIISWCFYKAFNFFTDLSYDGKVGNFCIISKKVLKCFQAMREKLRFFGGIVNWMGFKTAKVEVQHAKSSRGKSTYTFWKLWKMASEAIIAYSDKPLRLAVRIGFGMALISFLIGSVFLFLAVFKGIPLRGWASLIVSVYFLGGIMIGILGIVGIYVGKTFDETKKRPLFVIQNSCNVRIP